MPAVTASIALSDVYSTTAVHIRPDVALEIVEGIPLIAHMYRQKAVRYVGSPEVRCPVVINENDPNVSDLAKYGTFTTAPTDGPDTARYDRDSYNGTVRSSFVIAKEDIADNKGAEQIVSLTSAKMAQAKQSLMNKLSTNLYTAKAGDAMRGLPNFIEATAEASQTGTVGGISKAAHAHWRNRYREITAFANDGIRRWTQCFLDCSDQGSHPDIMLTDPDVFILYDELMLPRQGDNFDTMLYDLGFANLLFRGCPVVPDPALAGTGYTYFLTTTGKRGPEELGLKPEHFAEPGKNPVIKGQLKAVEGLALYVRPDHDFVLEGPYDLSFQQRVLSWNFIWSGMLGTGSLKRQGLTAFTGAVQ